jgi:large subunit ribosomal protein L2
MLMETSKRLNNSNRHKRVTRIVAGVAYRFSRLSYFYKKSSGRSKGGSIICAHRGGGIKSMCRIKNIFFRQISGNAIVLNISYNPFHNSFLNLLYFKKGIQMYVNSTEMIGTGDLLIVGGRQIRFFRQKGSIVPLKYISSGSRVHNLEVVPGQGSKYLKSAGMGGKLLKSVKAGQSRVRLISKQVLTLDELCTAIVGRAGNLLYRQTVIGSAGRNRRYGKRPIVRGTAKNAVDHPHGGKSGPGRSAVTP